jgi:hypothetical protein
VFVNLGCRAGGETDKALTKLAETINVAAENTDE